MPVTLFEEMGMNLHHDALVLVADGQKYLLLRNSGDFRNPVLKVEASAERSGAPTRDLGSDQPGRAFSSASGTPSAMEQTDWHQQAEDRFAAEAAGISNWITSSPPAAWLPGPNLTRYRSTAS
jgi:protein required for attachment to host cells